MFSLALSHESFYATVSMYVQTLLWFNSYPDNIIQVMYVHASDVVKTLDLLQEAVMLLKMNVYITGVNHSRLEVRVAKYNKMY